MSGTQIRDILDKPSCSVAEFAKLVGLSRNAAYEAIERGEVRAIRFGKRIVVPTLQLRRMLGFEDYEPRSAAS